MRVASAGVHASPGQTPSAFAVEALAEEGIDISRVRSQPLTDELVERADFIFTMTRGHLEAVEMFFPEAADKAFLVREFDPAPAPMISTSRTPSARAGACISAAATCSKRRCPACCPCSVPTLPDRGAYQAYDPPNTPPPGPSSFARKPPPASAARPPNHASTMQSSANAPRRPTLAETDPEIAAAIAAEELRQSENIELIASENFCSRAVREAQGSVFTNKYAEGYPGKRWYGGCENADVVEQLAIDRAKKLFGAEHVNVQPHSGAQANMAVYFSVLQPGDKILTMDLSHGGHLTHGNKANFSGRFYDVTSITASRRRTGASTTRRSPSRPRPCGRR